MKALACAVHGIAQAIARLSQAQHHVTGWYSQHHLDFLVTRSLEFAKEYDLAISQRQIVPRCPDIIANDNRGAQDPGDGLLCAQERDAVSGPGKRLFRRALSGADSQATGGATAATGPGGHHS